MSAAYQSIIDQFKKSNILVIGDIIIDAYLKGDSSRLSPEAPVPVVNIAAKEETVGGAANIALNLKALGAEVTFFSAVGDDADADKAKAMLDEKGIITSGIIREDQRRTMVKTRVMAKAQILARFDCGTQQPINQDTQEQLAALLKTKYHEFDAIVIGDYYGGILTPYLVSVIEQLQQSHSTFLAVDSKELSTFRSLKPSLVKPNYCEAIKLAGLPYQSEQRAEQAAILGELLYEKTGASLIALTLDAEGALLFKNGNFAYRSYGYNVAVPNVVGAGDTFISACTLSLLYGADLTSAAEIAVAAATVAVQKEDTAPCYTAELKSFFVSNPKLIEDADELKRIADRYKAQGKKLVFTNGCFDILHSGHVSYLNRAKELGDVLIVGLNCDESIQRLKGHDRPINPLEDRVEVLSGLSSIDHIISFGHANEDSPVELIKAASPHVFAKGGDYTKETLPEAALVEELGGKIEFVSYIPDHSTTRIIHRINKGNPMKLPA